MWSPTHVHLIVQKAENLLIKGKNETNNAFVVIELGKDSFRTSIKKGSGSSVVWNEECELKIPKAGNAAAIVLTAYHRNSLNLDQFLGTVRIPLKVFDKHQKSLLWYKLEGKFGKEKGKDKKRGELEVEIEFIHKAQSQSLTSLQSKGKISIEKLTGSLFGLRKSDRKIGVRKLVNGIKNKKKNKNDILNEKSYIINNVKSQRNYNNLDPGVVSEDEDSTSQKSSESLTLQHSDKCSVTPSPTPQRPYLKNPQISISHWDDDKIHSITSLNVSQDSVSSAESRKNKSKLEELRGRLTDRRLSISCVDFSLLTSPKPEKKFSSSFQLEKNPGDSQKKFSKLVRKLKSFNSIDKKELKRTVEGSEYEVAQEQTTLPKEVMNKNKDELINMVVDLQRKVNCVSVRIKDLEDYLDEILLKVMETVPKILEKS